MAEGTRSNVRRKRKAGEMSSWGLMERQWGEARAAEGQKRHRREAELDSMAENGADGARGGQEEGEGVDRDVLYSGGAPASDLHSLLKAMGEREGVDEMEQQFRSHVPAGVVVGEKPEMLWRFDGNLCFFDTIFACVIFSHANDGRPNPFAVKFFQWVQEMPTSYDELQRAERDKAAEAARRAKGKRFGRGRPQSRSRARDVRSAMKALSASFFEFVATVKGHIPPAVYYERDSSGHVLYTEEGQPAKRETPSLVGFAHAVYRLKASLEPEIRAKMNGEIVCWKPGDYVGVMQMLSVLHACDLPLSALPGGPMLIRDPEDVCGVHDWLCDHIKSKISEDGKMNQMDRPFYLVNVDNMGRRLLHEYLHGKYPTVWTGEATASGGGPVDATHEMLRKAARVNGLEYLLSILQDHGLGKLQGHKDVRLQAVVMHTMRAGGHFYSVFPRVHEAGDSAEHIVWNYFDPFRKDARWGTIAPEDMLILLGAGCGSGLVYY